MREKIIKSEAEWRAQLSPEAYHIAREKGTEQAFSGATHDNKRNGVYACVCCGQEIFSSATKFDSGTGWPSFWAPMEGAEVAEEKDNSLFMRRTEVTCGKCDAHLGHIFPDGPAPTGQRYCLNSAALAFKGS